MWPSVTSMIIMAGSVCVFPAAESADPVYKKVGDEIVLKPDSAYVSGTSITWKHGSNIAIDWDGDTISAFRQFKVRGSLNNSTGEMTIQGLTPDDGGLYTVEINGNPSGQTHITVISPVPTPTVLKTCDAEMTSCTLSCDGNTTGVELVTYKWKLDDKTSTEKSKEHIITKESSSNINEFSCELENPVSKESSQPIPNPFTTVKAPDDSDDTEQGNLKISAGLTVFISMLAAVLLMVLIHRWKAGMWFYQKESMPWEADFWRKHERPREAAESNGTTAHQEREHIDEETPMT